MKKQVYSNEFYERNRFEELEDIAEYFLTTNNARKWDKGGPIIGKYKDKYIYDGSDNHVGIFAATGGMKTRRFVLPMLFSILYAGESAIVHDPKAELYHRTSGLAQKLGYKTIVLNFRDPRHSNAWNPLDEAVRMIHNGNATGAKESIDDLFSILSPTPPRARDPYWAESARCLGAALTEMLMACGDENEVNFRSVYSLLEDMCGDNDDFSGNIAEVLELMETDSLIKSDILASAINAGNTMRCIISSTKNAISLFVRNRALLNMMSQTDFTIEDCINKKTVIYLITPDEKTTYSQLVALFVKQSYQLITEYAQSNEMGRLSIRMNYILEEFGNLPIIPDLIAMLTAGRGRNIRFMLCMQDMGAIRHKYDEVLNTILGNLSDIVFLFSREMNLLNYLSDLCGFDEEGNKLVSISMLQQFDKQKGEALLLVDRKRPYIAMLPDIDEYDFEQLPSCPYPETEQIELSIFHLSNLEECAKKLDYYEMNGFIMKKQYSQPLDYCSYEVNVNDGEKWYE